MSVTIYGQLLDIDSKLAIYPAYITEISRPVNSQPTDTNGNFAITLSDPDSTLMAEAGNYGDFAGHPSMFAGPVYLYKTGSPLSSVVSAAAKNHVKALPGTIITAVIIFLLFKLAKIV